MTRIKFFLAQAVLGATLVGATSVALAEEPSKEGTFFGYEAHGKWMIGVKGSKVQNSNNDFSDATNIGFLFGYEFARPVGFNGSASLEFEGTSTTSDGKIGADSDLGETGKWDVDTLAIYFAYRTPGTVYFKGKLGGVSSQVNNKVPSGNVSTDDASFAYGAGFGLRLGKRAKVELEYTGNSGDNDLGKISLGGILEF